MSDSIDVEITSETTARVTRAGTAEVDLTADDRNMLMRSVLELSQHQAAEAGSPIEVTITDAGRRRHVTVSPDGSAAPAPASTATTTDTQPPPEPVVMTADPPARDQVPEHLPTTATSTNTSTTDPGVTIRGPSPLTAPRTEPLSQGPARRGLRGRLNNILSTSLPPTQDSPEMRLRMARDRITAAIPDFSTIALVNLKGGVGKTPISIALASILATHRGAGSTVCADLTDTGCSLADRVAVPPTHNHDMAALLRDSTALSGRPAALSHYLSRQPSGDDILAGTRTLDTALTHDDAAQLARTLAHHRELLIADTGTNHLTGAWRWAVTTASVLIVPVPLRRDAAVAAHRMLADLGGTAISGTLVLITDGPGDQPLVETEAVEAFLELGVLRVLRMPFEPVFAGGERIVPTTLRRTTVDSLTTIAATAIDVLTQP